MVRGMWHLTPDPEGDPDKIGVEMETDEGYRITNPDVRNVGGYAVRDTLEENFNRPAAEDSKEN
jgi:hypothetical protein